MTIYRMLLFLFLGGIILTPLIHGGLFNVDKKYKLFRWVSLVLLIWWLIDFLRTTLTNSFVIYYFSLLVFPIVLLFTIIFYLAISNAFKHKTTVFAKSILGLIFIADLFLSLTNNQHMLFVELNYSSNVTFDIFVNAELGIAFYIHALTAYVILILTIVQILKNLLNKLRLNSDIYPFVFIIISIFLALLLNILHIFVYKFYLDPTLISCIILLSVLYFIFYIRDLKLILGLNRNLFILEHLREKYIIVNEYGYLIDASKEFLNLFDIDLNQNMTYNDLLRIISKKAVLFDKTSEIIDNYDPDKIYLNTNSESIKLPFYKNSGTFYLFFDLSTNMRYLNDMNYMKTHDLMSNIYNRNYLEDLRNKLDDNKMKYHVILFDLDGLKLINDYYGHDQGDNLIKRFANQLKTVSEDKDVLPIRFGGDEFMLLVINKNTKYVESIIDRLKEINEKLYFPNKIHYSYAMEASSENFKTLKEVLIQADLKLYKMKENKGNYKETLKKEILENIKK